MIDKIIKFFIRALVNLDYKRTHFFTYSWSIDELNEMYIQSEEVMIDKGYTRFGTKEIPHTHKETENDNKV